MRWCFKRKRRYSAGFTAIGNVKFMMTTIRRQLASCLYGLEPLLEEILSRHLDRLAWSEAGSTESMPTEENLNQIQDQIETILDRARTITARDRKLEALRKIIRDRQGLLKNKLMVFSSFRHTAGLSLQAS